MSSNLTVETTGTMMMIFSLAIGAVAGEIINIDQRMEQFGEWVNQLGITDTEDPRFVFLNIETPQVASLFSALPGVRSH